MTLPADGKSITNNPLCSSHIFNINSDWCAVCSISEPTLVGRRCFRNIESFFDIRSTNMNINILQIKRRIYITDHLGISHHNVLNVHIDEVVERINMLLHKPLDLQKCWN